MRTLALTVLLAGCTSLTDAGDRHTDPALGRDLQYKFLAMSPHAGTPLDVALVEDILPMPAAGRTLRLKSHARIVLPTVTPGTDYPDVPLRLSNVLSSAPAHVLFYADSNDDDQILHGITTGNGSAEHIWRVDVQPTGVSEFKHAFNFLDFDPSEYNQLTADAVLNIAAGAPDWRPAACGADHVLEVHIVLDPEGSAQEIGYFKTYASNTPPQKPIRIDDIVDSGSAYRIEASIDGALARVFDAVAPGGGADLVIDQADWYPTASAVSAEAIAAFCRAPGR